MNFRTGDIIKLNSFVGERPFGCITRIEPGIIWCIWKSDPNDFNDNSIEGTEQWVSRSQNLELIKSVKADPIEMIMREMGYTPSSFKG